MHIVAIIMEWFMNLFPENRFDDSNQCRPWRTRFMQHFVEVFTVCQINYESVQSCNNDVRDVNIRRFVMSRFN